MEERKKTRKCRKCGFIKETNNFYSNKVTGRFFLDCKKCCSIIKKNSYIPKKRREDYEKAKIPCEICGRLKNPEAKICKLCLTVSRKDGKVICGKPFKKGHKVNIGRIFSITRNRKISEAKKGSHPSEETRKKMSRASKGRKLSEETKRKLSITNKGEKSHLWKGGITPENHKIRTSLEYKLWRKSVFERDNFTCQKYGICGGKLVAHHINNFAEKEELRFAIDNGITLSRDTHNKFHKKYGWKNNTREQLDEFLGEFRELRKPYGTK